MSHKIKMLNLQPNLLPPYFDMHFDMLKDHSATRRVDFIIIIPVKAGRV
jgi:hypothetical protein